MQYTESAFVTEASCDACPKKCRVEMFTPRSRKWKDGEFKCIAGVTTPKWVGTDATSAPEPVFTRSLEDFSGPLSRRLLACVGCSMPCLLETEGLAVHCVLGTVRERSGRFGWNPVK